MVMRSTTRTQLLEIISDGLRAKRHAIGNEKNGNPVQYGEEFFQRDYDLAIHALDALRKAGVTFGLPAKG